MEVIDRFIEACEAAIAAEVEALSPAERQAWDEWIAEGRFGNCGPKLDWLELRRQNAARRGRT